MILMNSLNYIRLNDVNCKHIKTEETETANRNREKTWWIPVVCINEGIKADWWQSYGTQLHTVPQVFKNRLFHLCWSESNQHDKSTARKTNTATVYTFSLFTKKKKWNYIFPLFLFFFFFFLLSINASS